MTTEYLFDTQEQGSYYRLDRKTSKIQAHRLERLELFGFNDTDLEITSISLDNFPKEFSYQLSINEKIRGESSLKNGVQTLDLKYKSFSFAKVFLSVSDEFSHVYSIFDEKTKKFSMDEYRITVEGLLNNQPVRYPRCYYPNRTYKIPMDRALQKMELADKSMGGSIILPCGEVMDFVEGRIDFKLENIPKSMCLNKLKVLESTVNAQYERITHNREHTVVPHIGKDLFKLITTTSIRLESPLYLVSEQPLAIPESGNHVQPELVLTFYSLSWKVYCCKTNDPQILTCQNCKLPGINWL